MNAGWMPLYTGDWLHDPAVMALSPSSRGMWIDALCIMHQQGATGTLTADRVTLSKWTRSTPEEVDAFIFELQRCNAADVVVSNGIVTLTNRRMSREHNSREASRFRQAKHRVQRSCHADVTTGRNAECHGDVTGYNHNQNQKVHSTPPTPPPVKELPAHLQTPAMVRVWAEWQNIRRGLGNVKNWPSLFNNQIDFLAKFTEPQAVEILQQSMRNGWRGLFEPRNARLQSRTKSHVERDLETIERELQKDGL